MEDIDNSSLTTENGLMQVKPEISRDEQLAFIDTLRDIQSQQNQEIQDATHALGTDTTPQFGGINGTNSYWLQRYQTPQTEARLATLRTAAQSSALNTALNNYLEKLQEDYSNTYRKASKRSRNRSRYSSGGGGYYIIGGGNNTVTPAAPAAQGKVTTRKTYTATPEGLSLEQQRKKDEAANAEVARQKRQNIAKQAEQALEQNITKLYTNPNDAREAWTKKRY